jgi:DNA topoisomerase-1
MKPLIIVESPAKCKKIEGFLDNKFVCVASFGHIRELKDGLKCININKNFEPKFSLIQSKHFSKLKAAVKSAKEVYLATDDDREGEAIAWHICMVFKLPIETTKRILFHEITKPALQRAVQNPTVLDMDKVNAQLSRVVLDRLVGFMVSPILWKNINRKSGLSAGRCQTPALRLIYDNQKEIDANPGKFVFDTTGYFTQLNLPFTLNHRFEEAEKCEEFLEESANHDHIISKKPSKQVTKSPPKPFTTSTLQQTSSNVLHFSPKQTMAIAQKLYEGGYITYMRTDSKVYSPEFIEKTKKYIKTKYDSNYVNPNIQSLCSVKDGEKKSSVKKSTTKKKTNTDSKAQEAHEAIRPTKIELAQLPDSIDSKEKRLYSLIWKNTVKSCMSDAIYNQLEINISAPLKLSYKYVCEQQVFPGWKIIDNEDESEEERNYTFSEKLKNKSRIKYKKVKSVQALKELKQHYTEARLVQLLEKKGIGRPSTFSGLVSKIQERNYVKKQNIEGKKMKCVDYVLEDDTIEEIETSRIFGNEKNKLVLQDLGKIVLEFLIQHYDNMFNYEYTKNMEDELDEISQGNKVWHTLCKTCHDDIKGVAIKSSPKEEHTYKIDENNEVVFGKYGLCVKQKGNDGKSSFKKIKAGLTLEKIKNENLGLDAILEEKQKANVLGVYQDEDIIVCNGKFGPYVKFDGKTYSIKNIDNPTLENVIPILTGEKSTNPNVLKVLGPHTSIRKSKYGAYVYYKKPSDNKPRFLKLAGCNLDIEVSTKEQYLEWLEEKYEITDW